MPCAQVPRKDVALPWMTDPRWEADTLFLVLEWAVSYTHLTLPTILRV